MSTRALIYCYQGLSSSSSHTVNNDKGRKEEEYGNYAPKSNVQYFLFWKEFRRRMCGSQTFGKPLVDYC